MRTMESVPGGAASNPDWSPQGKVIGIVTRDQLQAVREKLAQLGPHEFQVLEGPAGIEQIDNWTSAVSQTFLGDMESEMVHRFSHAIHNGQIVFAAVFETATADEAAIAAKSLGATEVVHFGAWVVTNF
jgi:hypothetical protein